MPRILLTGLPNGLQGTEPLRDLLLHRLPLAVEGTAGFGISRAHVYAHAFPDLVDDRPARAIIFTVEGLLDKPERTAAMRRDLCVAIRDTLAAFLKETQVPYEVILGWCVRIDREEDGFVRTASGETHSL